MSLAKPSQITVPFSSNGVKNTIPETATGSNLASMQEGFPVITMTDVDQGGMPPQGQDMNGILFDVTKAIQYQQAGGLFPYDATFAQAIDGYPLGALLTSADGSCLYQNTVSGNVSDPDNGGHGWSQILSSASIAGKQDKLTPVQMDAVNSGITSARVAIYDSYAAGKQDTLTFDNTPTNGSSNPVTSDGIYAALGTKQDTITVDAVPTSGSANPVQSGGVYDALAEKVNIDNADNAEVVATGSTESRTLADWMKDVVGKVDRNAYLKKIVVNLPLKFPDYDTVKTALSATTLYPQGFDIDDSGNLYISYEPSSNSSRKSCIVKFSSGYGYVGYAYVAYGVESVVVKREGSELALYHRNSFDVGLYRYDITSASFNGETLTGTKVLPRIGQNFSYADGKWYIICTDAEIGGTQSRTFGNIYDDSFNLTGSFCLPKSVVGFASNASTYYDYIPKMQGFCVSGDNIIVSNGAWYSPSNETNLGRGDIGVAVLTKEGTVLRNNLLDADGFISALSASGVNVNHVEAEGCVVKNGKILSMYVVGPQTDTDGGVLLVEEFADNGTDYSKIASSYSPFNPQRYIDGTFPSFYTASTSQGGRRIAVNPVTGAEISTLTGLMDFMIEFQIPRTSFWTSFISFTPPTGVTFPSSCLVEILNGSNATFFVSVKHAGTGDYKEYSAFKNSSNVWSMTDRTGDLEVKATGTSTTKTLADWMAYFESRLTAGGL